MGITYVLLSTVPFLLFASTAPPKVQPNQWERTFSLGRTNVSHLRLKDVTQKFPAQIHEQGDVWSNEIEDALPSSWDWRLKGIVTPVRDQTQPHACGSCWAFSTVSVVESVILWATGIKPLQLAPQQLVSCAPDLGTCKGGYFAFPFYVKNGANYEEDFPYEALDVPCKTGQPQHERIRSWGRVGARGRYAKLAEIKSAIYTKGPIAALVVTTADWLDYTGGIYNHCSWTYENHMVTLVGWNDADQAFILKNSYGENWGEHGYMRIRYLDEAGFLCSKIGGSSAYANY